MAFAIEEIIHLNVLAIFSRAANPLAVANQPDRKAYRLPRFNSLRHAVGKIWPWPKFELIL